MKISSSQRKLINEKREQLQQIGETLKQEFFGIDEVIDQVIHQVQPWYLLPELQDRPHVVCLWGMTGVGKTALIRRLVQLLDMERRFFPVDTGEYLDNTSTLDPMFRRYANHFNGEHGIVMFDEFQLGRTVDSLGGEIERDSLRKMWELLDSGLIHLAQDRHAFHSVDSVRILLIKLKRLMSTNPKVDGGKVCSDIPYFKSLFDEQANDRHSRANETPEFYKSKQPFIIPYDYVDLFTEYLPHRFASEVEFRDQLSKMDLEEVMELVHEVFDRIHLPIKLDARQSLVFVLGNLDDAYAIADGIGTHEDPDDVHKRSLKITLSDIKESLKTRFRLEQLARLGNNHIIYRAMNRETYKLLIKDQFNKVTARFHDQFGIQFNFASSVEQFIWDETVVATQGARPTMQIFGSTMRPAALHAVQLMLINKTSSKEVNVHCTGHLLQFQLPGEETPFLEQKVVRKLRPKVKLDKDHKAVVAVHEAGHAIVSSLAMRIIPDEVSAGSNDAYMLGYCKETLPEVINRELQVQHIASTLAGLTAERIIFGQENMTIGSSTDMDGASRMALSMVKTFGMGDLPISVSHPSPRTNDKFSNNLDAEEQARMIIEEALEIAEDILTRNKVLILKMAEALVKRTVLKSKAIKALILEHANEEWDLKDHFQKRRGLTPYHEMLRQELKNSDSKLEAITKN